jgi:hypothetical protein
MDERPEMQYERYISLGVLTVNAICGAGIIPAYMNNHIVYILCFDLSLCFLTVVLHMGSDAGGTGRQLSNATTINIVCDFRLEFMGPV